MKIGVEADMRKMALATQIPVVLKKEIDAFCERRGCTISHFLTEALRDKVEAEREEEALVRMALERLAEPGERSYKEYRRIMRLMR